MNIKKKIKIMIKNNSINISPNSFFRIEFVVYCLLKVIGEFKSSEANLYFTQYYKKYYADSNQRNEILYFLRKKYHQYYSKKQFEVDINLYLSVPLKFRLFIQEDGYLLLNTKVLLFPDRGKDYDQLINRHFNYEPSKLSFLKDGGYYEHFIRFGKGYDENSSKKNFYVTFNRAFDVDLATLPRYREKKELSLPLDFDWSIFKKTLGGNWAERPSIKIETTDEIKTSINYDGLVHIVGLLGAGKSTYIVQETVRLLKDNNIKIGIIKPKVSEVIETYETLKRLGVRAIPIIGTSQLKKHQDRFINGRFESAQSFNEIINDNNQALNFLSSYCLLANYANDYEILPNQFPCNKLKKTDIKTFYNCPLYKSCGFFKKYLELLEADVWITTTPSVLASKANPIVDPFKRTYYELFHDLMDIIFVDEADSVQEDFDNRFMTDDIFYGGKHSIMKKFQSIRNLLDEEGLVTIESEAHRWITNYSKLSLLVKRLEYLIRNSPAYQKYLIRETLTPRKLFYSIVGLIENIDDQESQNFIESLETFLPLSESLTLNRQLMNHEIYHLYDRISKSPNLGNARIMIEEMLKEYVDKYNLVLKSSKTIADMKKFLLNKIELFIYIVLIDYFFRIQNSILKNLMNKLPEINQIIYPFKFYNRNFIQFISESVVGNVFGYKLTLNDAKRLNISLFNYSGIGRSLIKNWPNIKSEIRKKGPSVVMLSGTSYAPNSAHFHIATEAKLLLKSTEKEGNISQFINIKFEDKSNDLLKISGVSNQLIKKEKLKLLTYKIMEDIQYELNYWRERNQKKNVMIVVNSYDQCRIIGDLLREREFNYRVLSNNDNLAKDEINISQIEKIPSFGDVEVLITPLIIISRGYNIISESGDSYFGSAFFMIRPYLLPDDLSYNYRILNSVIESMMAEKSKKLPLKESFIQMRRFAYGMLRQFDEKKFWRYLDDQQRTILSWYTFIPVKQAVGRMQRNGNLCRVFYCDGSFVNSMNKPLEKKLSMLKSWENNLISINNGIGRILYGNYLEGLTKAIDNFEKTDQEGELF